MDLLDALLFLKEKALTGSVYEPNCGICYNLSGLTRDSDLSYDFVRNNCSDWESFSGLFDYPIEFSDDCDLWEGEQLELRLSLLDHLITKAKQQGV